MNDETPSSDVSNEKSFAASTVVRADVFEHSYREVLLFLKHEDDKINRVLTALAFLTAAAVTLYIFSRGTTSPDTAQLRGTDLTAADFYFASFIIGLVLALLAAIAALDPTSFYPRFIGAPDEPDSILYYRTIGQASGNEAWTKIAQNQSDLELRERLASSFHEDARRLSHRGYHKVYRFTECKRRAGCAARHALFPAHDFVDVFS